MQKTLAIQQADTKPKIGVDFHGVINTKPDFFREFCRAALKIGLEVYIISGGPRETILAYLNQYQIPYTKLWCIFDYYEQRHQVEFYDDGSFRIDDELWNKAKAEYCKEHQLTPISPLYVTSLCDYWLTGDTDKYIYKLELQIK